MLTLVLAATACRKQDMADQARQDPMDESKFFADGQSARPLVDGTVARGHRPIKEVLFAVTSGTQDPEAITFPRGFEVTRETLSAGREQFQIFCGICHGSLGEGNGMIVQRGFPRPPSFYTQRLRNAPVGHFYNVISNGYGAMYGYGDRVHVEDRWKIAAYIRALQASGKNPDGSDRIDVDVSRATTQPVR